MLRLDSFRGSWLVLAATVGMFSTVGNTALGAALLEQEGNAPARETAPGLDLDAFGEGAKYFLAVRVEPAEGGLRVEEVMPSGPADLAGLRQGDLIVEASGKKVARVDQFVQVVQASRGQTLEISLIRDGAPMRFSAHAGVLKANGEVVLPAPFSDSQSPRQQKANQDPPKPPQTSAPIEAPKPAKPESPQADRPKPPKADQPKPSQARPADSADRQELLKELARLREHSKKLEQQINALKAQLAKEKSEAEKPEAKKPDRKGRDSKAREKKREADKRQNRQESERKSGDTKQPDKA